MGLTPWSTSMGGCGPQRAVESTVTFHCHAGGTRGDTGRVEHEAPEMKSSSRFCVL